MMPKQILFIFICIAACRMSEQKEKYFQRQHNRFMKPPPRKELYQSAEVKNTNNDPQPKEETVTQSFAVKPPQPVSEEKTPFSLTSNIQDTLRRIVAAPKSDFESLIKDKILRQDLKKQERRLTKARNDAKLTVQPDTEISITALSSLLGLAEEYVNEVNKQKAQKIAPKTTLRLNQQKEILRQLTTIDEQIQLNNFAAVKSTIQILLKKYAKDELVQEKLGYLNYILLLNEEYEREAGLFRDLSLYVERLASIDVAPESVNQSNLSLKNLKKETTIGLNKENKKQQPNERVVKMITDVDKVGALLSGYVQSKVEKKIGETKTKRELQLEKELQERVRSGEFLEESSRYCKDLLQKTAESKEELFKQLEALKKNKKKSAEVPYSLILRVYESIASQKRQINEINLYLKAYSQFYIRKTLNAQNLVIELKKIDEKYAPNQTLGVIKPSIDVLINNVQQRERFTKQASTIETQLKKVKAENLRLQKLLSQNRTAQLPVQADKIDKRKELQQKRARDAQRLKQEREQKQIERSVDNIFNNLQEKKWKLARNAINVFIKRYEESTSPLAVKALQTLNTISAIMQDLESAEARALQVEKREKGSIIALQKERQVLNERVKSSQDYESAIKNLIETYSQEGFVVKKFFDDVRRDRKKIVQERYQLLMKLQDPLTVSRHAKLSEISQKVSLSLSQSNESELQRVRKEMQEMAANLDKEKERSFMLESKLKESTKPSQVNKDAEQLLNLAKRIEKGGQWWKFLPKNLKNSTFKHIYSILQKYRENELTIQSLQMFMVNEQLLKEEAATMTNAFDSALSLIKPEKDWYQQQFWTKNMSNYKGNQHCDKFINCLNQISGLTRQKIEEQRSNYKSEVAGYVLEIQNLSNAINDLQKRKDTHTEKSSSKFQESSSKKSPQLKTSRRVSRSKQKEKEGQVMNQAMQEYVQQQRKMLSKIEQLQSDKQNLQARAAAIENELVQTERRLDDQRIDFENARFASQRVRLQQLEKINELQGELEISEGRRIELQTALENDRNAFAQLQKELLSKLHQFQTREAIHLEQIKARPQQSTSQAEQRLTSQLNYYREMYGELSRELQVSKEREQQLLKDGQSLQRNIEILERKYEADVGLQQTATHDPAENNSSNPLSSAEQVGSPLKLKAHRVELKTEKIFELYLDSEPIRKRDRSNQVTPERVNIEGNTTQSSQVDQLRQVITGLQLEIRTLHEQRAQDIEREVVLALKNQENDFNEFLKGFSAEKQAHFLNEVLPIKLQQELALRAQASAVVSSNNYEFLHDEWIENEFPRLYDERHKRQCLNATLDVESIVNKRVQEAKEEFYRQNGVNQSEVNQRIERSLMQFQQNALPLIISQHQQQWQQAKAAQWEIKTRQIQEYWVSILEEQKKSLTPINSLIQQSPQKVIQREEVHNIIWRQPTEIELFQIMRREGNRHILNTLLGQELERWEQRKANEWIVQKNRLEAYWENVVLAEKYQEWERGKEKEIAELRVVLEKESERRLGEKQNEVLSAQKQTLVTQIPPTLSQPLVPLNEQEIIQRWKALNLPLIIQSQRRFAIQQFIAIDLPHIIQQERALWISTQSSPTPTSSADVDSLLILERQRWQEEKAREIAFLNTTFETRLNEILIAEHAEWQKNKTLQIQAILSDKPLPSLSPPADIDQLLQREHAHWQLVKLQQIRSLQLQFETRLNEIERKLNSQIIDYQQKFLREQNRMAEVEAAAVTRWRNSELPLILAKERESSIAQFRNKELPRILQEKYRDWETVDLIQLIHTERNSYIIDSIVSKHRKEWEKESLRQKSEYEGKIRELREAYENELIKLRQESERGKVGGSSPQTDMGEWQRAKNAEIQLRIKQVEHYWQTVILPQREDAWRKDQIPIVQELLSSKIAQVQATYQQNYIPKIIEEQWKKWQDQYQERLLKEKEKWTGELPSLLKPGGRYNHLLQSYLQSQTLEYQLQMKKIQAESAGSSIKIQQLTNQLAHYEQLLRENQTRYELSETKVKTLLNEQDSTVKRTLQESQRLNEEVTRSRWAEKEVEDLRKIIEMQKGEINKLATSLREGERLRLENISLQEANNNLQKMKWQQINDLRTNYQTKLIQLTSERNVLQGRVSQLQGKSDPAEKQALLSYQRQITILNSTIKTKDTEITFLKKTIETVNNQLRQNRQKLNEQLQKRGNSERALAQLKNIRLQLDYQIKYLKDREESLSKKLELKDQQMLTLRKKIDLDNDSIEKKLKSSLQYAASYQVKFSQLESMLTYKTKQAQALLVQADRLRYENQGLTANLQSLTTDVELYKRQVRELQGQKIALSTQRDRSLDETSRLKQLMVQYEEQIKRGTENMNRMSAQFNTEKTRLQGELKRNREEILHLEIQLKDTERIKRIQMDRANKLQREIAENTRQAELGEIQVLKKINRDVSDLTAANRQLEMKCLLLQNKERITPSASETINSYLLTQKYTDQLLDYLLKEGIVPNLELYHKFLSQSRTLLAGGRGQEYYQLWQKMLRELFQLTISCRSQQIRTQAQELLRLRDEMTQVLERQIEVSEGDQNQLVEDYKQVLNDIKSLVREYMRTGDEEYLRLLCGSLGIAV